MAKRYVEKIKGLNLYIYDTKENRPVFSDMQQMENLLTIMEILNHYDTFHQIDILDVAKAVSYAHLTKRDARKYLKKSFRTSIIGIFSKDSDNYSGEIDHDYHVVAKADGNYEEWKTGRWTVYYSYMICDKDNQVAIHLINTEIIYLLIIEAILKTDSLNECYGINNHNTIVRKWNQGLYNDYTKKLNDEAQQQLIDSFKKRYAEEHR